MVLTRRDGRYEALAADGRVTFRRTDAGDFVEVAHRGPQPARRPVDRQVRRPRRPSSPSLHPHRRDNAYPFAYDQTAQLFDSPAAPDLCVIHSAAHNWEDQGGHLGEHGSLGIVQARAPFVIGGKGVQVARRRSRARPASSTSRPRSPRCSAARRAPTARYLARPGRRRARRRARPVGAPAPRRRLPVRRHQPERALRHVRARRGAERRAAHRDGHRVRARRDGVAADGHAREPHVDHHRRAPRPPRHPQQRVVRPRDRRAGHHQLAGDVAVAMQHLTPGIESIHDAVHRTWPDAFTASVNEPCDIGADYSTFDFFRRGEVPPIPKDPFGLPHTTERFVRPSKDYSWSSVVDHMGIEQALGILGGHYRDVELPAAPLHVVQLHAHRRRDARRRPALRDGGRVGPRQRRPPRRDPRRARAARRVRRHRVRARRRPRHGGERPRVPRRLGRRAARGRPRRSATRPTASSTSASDRAAQFDAAACGIVRSRCGRRSAR